MSQVFSSRDSTLATSNEASLSHAKSGQRSTSDRSRLLMTLGLLLFIVLGFALRVHALEYQSMWSDEGLSYYRATLPASEVLQGLIVIDGVETKDTNPPLYFLLLHFWRTLTGESVFTLRFSGALAGTLAIPLIFILGSAIYGRWVGLAAALLMAISPFHVWQSQVLRNYSLLVTLNLASVYGLFRYLLSSPGQIKSRWLALWLLAGLLGIYVHYFGFLVFAFGALALLLVLAGRWQIDRLVRQKRFWLALGGGLLLLLPAVAIGLERFQAGPQIDFHQIGLVPVLIHAASAFAVGIEPSLAHAWWRILPALLLACAGLIFGWRRRWQPTAVLLGYQFVPLGLLLLLSTINPLYNGVRHLLIGLPPFLLFAANGAFAGSSAGKGLHTGTGRGRLLLRWLGALLFVWVIIVQLDWLYTQFTDQRLLRDDIRGAAEYLNHFAGDDDIIILHDTIIGLTFDYYYEGEAPTVAIPALYEQDVSAAQAAMESAAAGKKRIWFLARPTPRTGFPRKELWEWADEQWPRIYIHEFPSMWLRVELVGYSPQPILPEMPEEAAGVDYTFGEAMQLHGVEIPPVVKAGETWWASLYWSKLAENIGDVGLSLRFVDDAAELWGQDDGPLWFDFPPDQWPTDALVGSEREILLPSGIPPGEYDVMLRLLDGDGRPLPVNGDQIEAFIGQMAVIAGTEAASLPSIAEQQERLGDVQMLGYKLPEDEIRPGHAIPIELFWRARQTPIEDFRLRVDLIDQAGVVIGNEEALPTRADYPPTAWQEGEILQSKILLNVPASAAETPHTLRVVLLGTDGQESGAAVTLKDKLVVDPWPFVAELPADLDSLDADFGDPNLIALRGADIISTTVNPGELLPLTLYWQAYADVDRPYYIFLHLMDENESIAAQVDRAPANGFRPTVSWRAGEVIKDDYVLPIGEDLPPGQYKLYTGLYNPDTFERPMTKVDGQVMPGQNVFLGDITVGQQE